jgi:hypothetical protein
MQEVKQNKTIEVIMPMNDVMTLIELQPLIMQAIILDLATERLEDLIEDAEYKKVYFNNIETEHLQYFISQGYEINMLNSLQTPYITVDVAELDKPFKDTEILLKDYTISYHIDGETAKVEIGHYPNGSNRNLYTQSEELYQWGLTYGNKNISINDRIIEEITEQI